MGIQVPSGGGAVAGGAPAAGGGGAAPAAEEKKEEKAEEKVSCVIVVYPFRRVDRRLAGGIRRRHGLRTVRLKGLRLAGGSIASWFGSIRHPDEYFVTGDCVKRNEN